jgi:hypothetical protein
MGCGGIDASATAAVRKIHNLTIRHQKRPTFVAALPSFVSRGLTD